MSSNLDEQSSQSLVDLLRVKLWNRLKSLNKLLYAGNLDESREEIRARIELIVDELLAEQGVTLSQADRPRLMMVLLAFDAASSEHLEALAMDDTIQEIVVIGPRQVLFRRAGTEQFEKVSHKCFDDEDHLLRFIYRMFVPLGYYVDADSPCAQAKTPDGSQLRALVDTLGTGRSVLIMQRAAK